MNKMLALLATFALLLTACGGESDETETGSDTEAEQTTSEADESGEADQSDAATSEMVEEGGESASVDDDADITETETSTDTNVTDTEPAVTIESIDDLPGKCRDLLVDFLSELEPLVKDVDWENASMTELDTIFESLDATTGGFDEAVEADRDCAGLSIEDHGFGQVIEFAKGEAPGTVAFLEFTNGLMQGIGGGSVGGTDDEPADDCEGSLAKFEELAKTYETAEDAPFSELAAAQTGILFCSQAQLEAFSEDYADFLGDM